LSTAAHWLLIPPLERGRRPWAERRRL